MKKKLAIGLTGILVLTLLVSGCTQPIDIQPTEPLPVIPPEPVEPPFEIETSFIACTGEQHCCSGGTADCSLWGPEGKAWAMYNFTPETDGNIVNLTVQLQCYYCNNPDLKIFIGESQDYRETGTKLLDRNIALHGTARTTLLVTDINYSVSAGKDYCLKFTSDGEGGNFASAYSDGYRPVVGIA